MIKDIVKYLSLVIVLTCVLYACSEKEVVVSVPKGESSELDVQMSREQESKIKEVIETNENLTIEEKEKIFFDLLDLGAGDYLEYNQNLYEVKENGYMYDYNTMEKIPIKIEDFLDNSINELKKKATNLDERQGDDWEYINSVLNLPDFGNDYKAAFYNDGSFHYNELIGVFKNEEEMEIAFNEFTELPTIKEKAKYLKNLLGKKDNSEESKKNNDKIVKEYINSMISLIYGNDKNKVEIKFYEYSFSETGEGSFAYIIGDIITPETKKLFYVEDYVKGKIENGKFIRELEPKYSDFYDSPEYVMDAPFLIQSSSDAGKIRMGTQIEDVINVYRDNNIDDMWIINEKGGFSSNVYYGEIMYEAKANYITEGLNVFNNMNVEDLKNYITKELPVFRKLVIVDENFDKNILQNN